MSTVDAIVRINRVGADGTNLGDWKFGVLGAGFLGTAPDGTERPLRSTSLLEVLAVVPDAIRLAPHVVYTVTCDDPDIQPSDLAEVFGSANPDLADIWWQDTDGWDEDLFYRQVDLDFLFSTPNEVEGNLPLTINGARCLPTNVEGQTRLLPFDVVDSGWLQPRFSRLLGELSARNEWGTYSAQLGVLPRGYLCDFALSDGDPWMTFTRLSNESDGHLRSEAFEWVSGVLDSFAFQQSPRVQLLDGGDVSIVWPDGYDPADFDESASALIL